jgi:hypothetical protein
MVSTFWPMTINVMMATSHSTISGTVRSRLPPVAATVWSGVGGTDAKMLVEPVVT